MNPWDILAWVSAICISLVVIALSISLIVAALKPKTSKTDSTLFFPADKSD